MIAIRSTGFLEQLTLPRVFLCQHFRRELKSKWVQIGPQIVGGHRAAGHHDNVTYSFSRDRPGARLIVGNQAGAYTQSLGQVLLAKLSINPELK